MNGLASTGKTQVEAGLRATAAKIGRFVLHFLEMCLAMCIGGITLNVLFFTGAAKLGYPDLVERFPEFSVLAIGVLLALPMAAWMGIRGHGWRLNLEMSASSIVLALALIAAGRLGLLSSGGMLEWMTGLACPAMLVPMLFRLDHYTGHHATHSAHAADPETEKSCH